MEILFKDKKTNKIIKLVYTQKEKYENSLKVLRKAEQEGKGEIIPQDINEFIKTGIKR